MPSPFKSSKVQAFKVLGFVFVLALELLNPLNLEPAFAQANFYQGKTVKVIVGTAPGGGYDLWARLMAQHIGKHIPGNPTVVVQNMPGAGGADRCKLHLRRRQARWTDSRLLQPGALLRPTGRRVRK